MREIKFRAWNKIKNFMVLPGIGIPFPTIDDGIPNEEYILMQFTGLKDKNSKEIYEGDILKLGLGEVFLYQNEHESYFAVKWHNNTFKNIRIDNHPDNKLKGCEPLYVNFSEVIGNIYENPELLKGDINGKD